jgi:diguanylate cyclase (GGDEF)-like protein/PAS domain S-box-containing protein
LLLVDDEINNRISLSRRLERRGYSVETAEGGGEALDKLLREHYDLVLLDQMMPGMSGLDLLKLLRASYSETELPVIMVTALDENQAMAQALEEGANDYVLKPVEMPDITARIQTQLPRSKPRRRPGEGADAAWDWDPQSGTAHFSAEWAELVGCDPAELREDLQEWLGRIHPGDLVRVRRELRAHLEGAAVEFHSEHRLLRKDGSHRWMVAQALALRQPGGRLLRVTGSFSDLANRHGADPLTGLRGRAYLIDHTTEVFCQAHLDRTFAMLLVDLDDFRMLNEHAGHEVADQVLQETAVRLRNALAKEPYLGKSALARVGADEFAVLTECANTREEIKALAESVLGCFQDPILSGEQTLIVLGSVGMALGSSDGAPDRLLRDADLALRQTQRQGRLSWTLFEPALRNRAHMRATLARDLHYAVEREQLAIVYQPKVELRTGCVAGFEALMRWRHPEFGLVQPADFIPLAEETGDILAAGDWIMRQACRQLALWQASTPQLRMSVNLSPRQVSDPNLVSMVRKILAETGIDPVSLGLELTESSLIEEEENARNVLANMRQLGVRVMLDDFGTGYASLYYLNALRFDALKIDRSFVSQMDSDTHCLTIVRTILGLTRELNMDAIAEGIETEAQLRMLVEMGCEMGQGFYFSKPVDAVQAGVLLAKGFAPQPESVAV